MAIASDAGKLRAAAAQASALRRQKPPATGLYPAPVGQAWLREPSLSDLERGHSGAQKGGNSGSESRIADRPGTGTSDSANSGGPGLRTAGRPAVWLSGTPVLRSSCSPKRRNAGPADVPDSGDRELDLIQDLKIE
jgi:hypothetical protein